MGTTAMLALTGAQVGLSLLGSLQQQDAAMEQARAQQDEFVRQQNEVDRQAAEERSDIAREADKRAAAAIAAMEAIGGAGSINDARVQAEIAGIKAIDLSRLEGNRMRKVASLDASIQTARSKARATIAGAKGGFLSSALKGAGTALSIQADADQREFERKQLTGTDPKPQGPSGRI